MMHQNGQNSQPIGVILSCMMSLIPTTAWAQTFNGEGKLQQELVNTLISESDAILSYGRLSGLEADPNFVGTWDMLNDSATTILAPYTPVSRGGFFPENADIPLEQQLTMDECAYQLFQLDNGNELMLYSSPSDQATRYLIRGATH